MFKNAAIATILGLSSMAACAADTGSQSRDLATGDIVTGQEGCYRVLGDYDGDVTPPPINISIGDIELNAPNTMVEAQSYDGPYARLLGEFVAVQVNIDAGAEIDSDDIDVLIRAEDELIAAEAGGNLRFHARNGARFEAQGNDIYQAVGNDVYQAVGNDVYQAVDSDLVSLIAELSDINRGMRIEVPCMDASNEGVFEVDTPLPDRDKRMHERIEDASAEASAPSSDKDMQDRVVGASSEDAASSNGFHRPSPRPRPPHRPYR